VRGRPLTHQLALERAAGEVFGLRVDDGATPVADVEPWGKTDRQILRDVLARAGLPHASDEAIARWERIACELYMELEVDRESSDELSATAAALGRLRDQGHALALVTGNLEPIARRKLALRGLGDYFPRGQGGFGSDAERRPELVPIARARAADGGPPQPSEDTVLIGDTPLDVAAAAADGVRCVAITGKRFSARVLREAGAAATVDEIPEVEAALAELASA
jgi:phosphoglycolate phosphatase